MLIRNARQSSHGGGEDDSRRLIISYLTLRRIVGFLGLGLPPLLVLGDMLERGQWVLRGSLSAYYESVMGDVFVGVLFVIGWFLFSYRGYEPKDHWAGNFAGICAMGVALFPSSVGGVSQVLHVLFAALLFLDLAYFSMALFTKTSRHRPPTPEKLVRNRVYRVCGVGILASLVAIAITWRWGDAWGLADLHPVFWFESLALLFFGFSWCVKGEVLWTDAVEAGSTG